MLKFIIALFIAMPSLSLAQDTCLVDVFLPMRTVVMELDSSGFSTKAHQFDSLVVAKQDTCGKGLGILNPIVIGDKIYRVSVTQADNQMYSRKWAEERNALRYQIYKASPTTGGDREIKTGRRGGKYYINKNGNKTYVK
jgi:hypothetical protein